MELELEDHPVTRRQRGQTLGTNAAAGAKVIAETVPSGPDPAFRDRATKNTMLEQYRAEIDDYVASMKLYASSDSDVVLLTLSSHHARLVEMRIDLKRQGGVEGGKLITNEIDPILEAMGTQFKFHSRYIATMEAELRMTGGYT